jgi:SSS family solute:Na+ symporter
VIAILVARPLLGASDQAFQFIQEFTGFFTPGIVVMFMLGLFWKRASEAGAIAAALSSVLLSYLAKEMWPDFPFMNRMGAVFLAALALAVAASLAFPARRDANLIVTRDVRYGTPASFNIPAIGVILILIALYATWW